MADDKYQAAVKKVWILYIIAVIALIIFLVTVVAQDTEELFFYSLMTAGASYAFRPNTQVLNYFAEKLFGITPPEVQPELASTKESDGQDD